MQRRKGRGTPVIDFLVLAGLMIPPAVVPTVWVLNGIGLFKTLPGLILVEVALSFPFSALLYKGFMGSIPREIDESAVMDGCNGLVLFLRIIFPPLILFVFFNKRIVAGMTAGAVKA